MTHLCEFDVDGWTVAYEEYGPADGTPLVYIHGILLDSRMNRPLAQALAGHGNRVILVDMLGHGRSDRPDHASHYRVEHMARHTVALLDHLGIATAAIGGVSLGAAVALTCAVQSPDRVHALICEMPVLERGAAIGGPLFMLQVLACRYLGLPLAIAARLARGIPETGHGPVDAAVAVLGRRPRHTAAVLHGVMVGSIAPSAAQRRQVSQPALVVAHPHDPLHALADSRKLAAELPGAEILQVPSVVSLRVTAPSGPLAAVAAWLHTVNERQTAA